MRNINSEPLPLIAELVNESGQPVTRGLLTLSPTPDELEFRSSALPYQRGGDTVGFIIYSGSDIKMSIVGRVGFYGNGIIGVCLVDSEGMARLVDILAQNISLKTFAVHKPRLFSRRELFDISITKIGLNQWSLTTIDDIKVGMELTLSTDEVIYLKKVTLKIDEIITLKNNVSLCRATPQNLSKENIKEIERLL